MGAAHHHDTDFYAWASEQAALLRAVPALPRACPLSIEDLLDADFDPDVAVAAISAAIQKLA